MKKIEESQASRRIRGLMSSMPYSGLASWPPDRDRNNPDLTLDQIGNWLEGLREVIREVADEHNDLRAEVSELKSQRRAFGTFLVAAVESAGVKVPGRST